jgi:hypothetical protein
MRPLWIDIEQVVLNGVPLDPAKGQRLAALTRIALERLLRERGISNEIGDGGAPQARAPRSIDMKSAPAGDEARWADELAAALYRTIASGIG